MQQVQPIPPVLAEPNPLAIVPFQPTLNAVLLRIWAYSDQQVSEGHDEDTSEMDRDPVLIDQVSLTEQEAVPKHSDEIIMAKKNLLSAFDGVSSSQHAGLPPRPPSNVVSLPTVTSAKSVAMPVVSSQVRRNSRANKYSRDFKNCQLPTSQRRKRKSVSDAISSVAVPEGGVGDIVPGPIPVEVLQGWGIECGVHPSEVSETYLLKKPCNSMSNDANA